LILKRHHHEKSICGLNWQNPANDRLRTLNSRDFLQSTRLKLQAASFKLQATNYELQVASYKLRDRSYKIVPAPADYSIVQPCSVVWLYSADLYRTLIEPCWLLGICTGWWRYGTSAVPYYHKPV
jgi:hypothetical protein